MIFWTLSSGPCDRLQWDQGRTCPGGVDNPWTQKIVAALKTKLPFGPGYSVAVHRWGRVPPTQAVPSPTISKPGISVAGWPWYSQPIDRKSVV